MSRRVLMISAQLPSRTRQESAGEQLALRFVEFWESRGSFLLVTGAGPANRRAVERGGTPEHRLLAARGTRLERLRSRLITTQPIIPSSALHGIPGLAEADVIDLQWEEQGWLLPALRRAAPTARISITLHDVVSQRFARTAAASRTLRHRLLWRMRTLVMRRLERRIMRSADDVIVLSEKDALLLPRGGRARVHVLPPPIDAPLRPVLAQDAPPRLLFVGYLARRENRDAVQLLVDQVLPRIRQEVPDVELTVIGAGMDPELAQRAAAQGVRLPGFVEDLEPEYDRATAIIVPLQDGAGVKLKVVEAMLRGIPVITTPVGIEGIPHGPSVSVAEEPDALASAAVRVLRDHRPAQRAVREHAPGIAERFSSAAFRRALEEMDR